MSSFPRLLCAATVAVLALTQAPELHAQQQPELPPALQYRKNVMQGLLHHREAMGALVEGRVQHPAHLGQHSSALRALATMAADVFPEGSGGEPSAARPGVWENRADFEARMKVFQDATYALDDAVRSGDQAAIRQAWGTFGRSCGNCHREYRVMDNP